MNASTDFDKKLKRNINTVKQGINNLTKMGLHVEIDKNIENMMGSTIDNVYVVDRIYGNKGRVILQKRLFTARS